MKDYSQSGEQKIILDYFGYPDKIRGLKDPCALDIGANDGVLLSNSRALVELGWNAVLVEPAEIAFRKLVTNNLGIGGAALTDYFKGDVAEFMRAITDGLVVAPNARVKLVQAAITTTDGPIDFYDSGTHLKKGDTSLLSTTRPEEMARWKKSGEVFTKTTVRGITVAALLKETGLTRADFVSIDCEGVDLSVLQQLDLTALQTRMVCVEVNRNDQRPFDEYCAKHGLRLLHRNFENAIYCV